MSADSTRRPKILGIIPARGNSTSIPRKNIKNFAGKPLLAWSAIAATSSGVLDRLIISTDDEEIAAVAKEYGVEVPFIRPAELAQDATPTLPVLQHAVATLKEQEGYYSDYVLLLEPTSPGRQPFHIKEAIELAIAKDADSVVALGSVPGHFNYRWQTVLDEEGRARLADGTPWPEVVRRRQDLPPAYFRNGAFYLFKTSLLFAETPSFYGEKVFGYPLEPNYSMDIDTPEDWAAAEKMMAALQASASTIDK